MSKPRPPSLLVNGLNLSNGLPVTPTSPGFDYLGSTLKNRRSLKQLWDEADKRFFEETGYHIETASPQHKGGVLQKWQARYDGEKSSMQSKLDKLSPILHNIVNGIEIVGGFAASTAAAVFGPAQMCFNAVTFLLDAPGKIKHVYDCLEELLREVANFLVKFRILERIDQKGDLDIELLENANKLLISFTHICAVATTLLKKKRFVLQALEVVFLTNDGGVSAALAEFKDLAVNQAQTVGVISLEHILQNENLSRQILSEQSKLTAYLRAVATKENDEKTKLITKQKISEIETRLFTRNELDQLEQTLQTTDILHGTLDVLMSSKEYGSWSAIETGGTSELHLSGANGTGKTHFIDALREHLAQKRQNMLKQGPSLYVAYHSFADRRTTLTSQNAVSQALKSMALQVARQSTRYSERLVEQLRDQKLTREDDMKKTWSTLKLLEFLPPPGSVMYLLIDGLQDEDGYKSMQALRRMLVDAKTIDSAGGRFKVCVLLAGTPEVIQKGYVERSSSVRRSAVIDVGTLNQDLLRTFIDREFRANEILIESDAKTQAQRAKFATSLLHQSGSNFDAAKQKIKRMKDALEDDATSKDIQAIIEEDVQRTFDQQAQETLDTLAKELSAKHLKQLKKILMWMLYGLPVTYGLDVYLLEAILRMQQKDDTLESLTKKIRRRFHKILTIEAPFNFLWLEQNIRDYLGQSKDAPLPERDDSARLISMTINIQNAKKTEVQKFILDLNTQLSSDASIFQTKQSSPQGWRIQILEVDSLVEIILFALTVLNEGPPEDIPKLLRFCFRWLPRNLTELWKIKDKVSASDSRRIQTELAKFLSDPYYLEHTPGEVARFNWDYAWFGADKAAQSIGLWLDECLKDPATNKYLPARQRRWLKEASTRNDGRPDYLRDTALALASRWRTACLESDTDALDTLVQWLQCYLESLTVPKPLASNDQDSAGLVNKGEIDNNQSQSPVTQVMAGESSDSPQSPAGVHSSSHNSLNNVPPTLTEAQRLYKVAEWTRKNLPGVQEDAKHFYCMGVSLYGKEQLVEAITCFEKAKSDDEIGWRAIVGLAQIKNAQKLPEEAAILYQQAVSLARSLEGQGKLAQHEVELFCSALRALADILDSKLKQPGDAVGYFHEILSCSPQDGQSRWFLFGALCREDRYQEATQLLDHWSHCPGECGDESPTEVLRAMAAKKVDMFPLFEATRQSALRDRLLRISEQAANEAGSRLQFVEQTGMLYVLATAYANDSSTEYQGKALQYLENILELSQTQLSDRNQFDAILADSLRFASRLKFDAIRKQFQDQDLISGSGSSPESLREELNRYVTKQVAAYSGGYIDLYWYVASLCMIMKQPQWSRDLLKQEIADGVQILSDDIAENDVYGSQRLVRAFLCLGDDVNANIAFSLERVPSFKGEGESDPNAYYRIGRGCETCETWMDTPDGHWICRWCPEVDFCLSCIHDFREGRKRFEHCGPDHDFVHIQDAEWTQEELNDGKVFVDWEFEYKDNGKFVRKGGRPVEVAEWLERLRVEWDLPPPSTDTRAQA